MLTWREHVDELQTALGRRVLIENPSTYVTFTTTDMSEVDFLSELVRRTGCGLLLDCNNVYVCAVNHHFDPAAYIDAFPVEHAGEIHLAGYAEIADDDGSAAPHRRPRPHGARRGVGALCARHRPRRRDSDADRVGQRRAGWEALHAEAMKAERILSCKEGVTRAA